MTPEEKRKRFFVIENEELENKQKENIENKRYRKAKASSYITNPLREQLAKFVNDEAGPRFTVKDLLNW